MKKGHTLFLTDAQLKEEIRKCEYCAEKPCKEACPVDCSPADFIMAAKGGRRSDFKRAAAIIMGSNPLGGVCGAVCPDWHCMKACVHKNFDSPVNIPPVQATIVQKAKDLKAMPEFRKVKPNGKRVAVVGAGPAGIGTAAVLAQKGYRVDVFDSGKRPGGMIGLIPPGRLDPRVLKTDMDFVNTLGAISVKNGRTIPEPNKLLRKGYRAVVVAAGRGKSYQLGIPGEEAAIDWIDYLQAPARFKVKGRRVAVIGGGAVAADCAATAAAAGAAHVEMFALEKLSEMPLTAHELTGVMRAGVHVSGRISVTALKHKRGKIYCVCTMRMALPKSKKFDPRAVKPVEGSKLCRKDLDFVIRAIGSRPALNLKREKKVFFAGDMENGPTTVVEAVAAGKNAALEVDAFLCGRRKPNIPRKVKSRVPLDGRVLEPVSLETDFFGRKIRSPFILSAAPPSDGYAQMQRAYEAGWAGGIMKTAFDDVPIHIPGEYMFAFNQDTYANCDNVSGHSLSRVCRELKRLIGEYPDRLTMASTGGPVTGDDEADRLGWQANTRKLEAAGVHGIEYSLSCPQGGDGTKGDIVSQDPELTARIVNWIMEKSDPDIPKLFKLTGAVTAIYPIMAAIKEVLSRYPRKKAGVTLANTFPTLAFRGGEKKSWEEGIVVGMSGEGVAPISNLTLANASRLDMHVSGNGGPMDYKAAADFLALGTKTVQFCTVVMKYGYGIIDDLHSGLSHLMQERGYRAVGELIGCALPDPIRGFMDLTPVKKISVVRPELCEHCGNCSRCPYLAIRLDARGIPKTDPARCIGCSICVQKCFAGALYMKTRSKRELALLKED